MEQEGESYQVQHTNQAYIEPNVLQLRLDTQELLERIELFLSGKKLIYIKTDTGEIETKDLPLGDPLANDKGVRMITNWIGMQLTPSTVQGFIKETAQYFYYLERTRKTLARILLINSPKWKINRDDRPIIASGIMNMLELFVSRTLDNSERESYSHSLAARVGQKLTSSDKPVKRVF